MKYRIIVGGILEESWKNWLSDFNVLIKKENNPPLTIIDVDIPDQHALIGIIIRLIRDLNLPLVSITQNGE